MPLHAWDPLLQNIIRTLRICWLCVHMNRAHRALKVHSMLPSSEHKPQTKAVRSFLSLALFFSSCHVSLPPPPFHWIPFSCSLSWFDFPWGFRIKDSLAMLSLFFFHLLVVTCKFISSCSVCPQFSLFSFLMPYSVSQHPEDHEGNYLQISATLIVLSLSLSMSLSHRVTQFSVCLKRNI